MDAVSEIVSEITLAVVAKKDQIILDALSKFLGRDITFIEAKGLKHLLHINKLPGYSDYFYNEKFFLRMNKSVLDITEHRAKMSSQYIYPHQLNEAPVPARPTRPGQINFNN
ncbi:MAG: hypothetical protein PF440_01630 [Thiomicrorhabdus sp.]|jgi:hypothetical protein|nr:hypothetical protein [Thiomicrorhabdus sp.]